MRFVTEADRQASEHQRAIAELRAERLEAAESGDHGRLDEIDLAIAERCRGLATARAMAALAECRHCGEQFEPVRYTEIVIAAIVRHRPVITIEDEAAIAELPAGAREETETQIFDRGQERRLIYCEACTIESGLLDYLNKR
jgi:hypothetical protein